MKLRSLVAIGGLSLALGACGGDDDGGAPDATPLDSEPPPDAAPDAVPSGPVTITVRANGQPIPGIDIVFSDPDGEVVSHEQTGAGGAATETLAHGGAVTIAVAAGKAGRFLITFAAVEPGDQLEFEFGQAPPPVVGDVSVTLPGVAAGAVRYEVRLGCTTLETNNPVLPVTGGLPATCLGSDQAIDAIAIAFDASGVPVGHDHVKGVAVVDGGTTNVTLDAWQTGIDPLTITLTNAPADTGGAGMEGHWIVDGVDFLGFGGGAGPVGGTVTLQSAYPAGGFAERLAYLVFVGFGTPQVPAGFGILMGARPDAPAAVTHDLAAVLLPRITEAAAAHADGTLELTWTAGGSLAAADGALVLASWDAPAQWFALLPPSAASPYRLPALPEALSAFRPTGTSAVAEPTVIFAEADFIDGYHAWRHGAGFQILGDGALGAIPPGGGLMRATLGGALPGGD